MGDLDKKAGLAEAVAKAVNVHIAAVKDETKKKIQALLGKTTLLLDEKNPQATADVKKLYENVTSTEKVAGLEAGVRMELKDVFTKMAAHPEVEAITATGKETYDIKEPMVEAQKHLEASPAPAAPPSPPHKPPEGGHGTDAAGEQGKSPDSHPHGGDGHDDHDHSDDDDDHGEGHGDKDKKGPVTVKLPTMFKGRYIIPASVIGGLTALGALTNSIPLLAHSSAAPLIAGAWHGTVAALQAGADLIGLMGGISHIPLVGASVAPWLAPIIFGTAAVPLGLYGIGKVVNLLHQMVNPKAGSTGFKESMKLGLKTLSFPLWAPFKLPRLIARARQKVTPSKDSVKNEVKTAVGWGTVGGIAGGSIALLAGTVGSAGLLPLAIGSGAVLGYAGSIAFRSLRGGLNLFKESIGANTHGSTVGNGHGKHGNGGGHNGSGGHH